MATPSTRRCTDSAIRSLESDVAALESYRDTLETQVQDWINDAFDFDTGLLTDPFDMAQDVVNNMTTTTFGCDDSQIPQLPDFIQDCLNKIRGELNRKIKNIERDTAGVALAALSVAERFLCSSLSDLISQFERYSLNRLLDAIERNQTCILSSKDAATWADQMDDMNDRIDQVIDDLPIDASGNFDFDKLTEGLDSGLKQNLDIYKTQTDSTVNAAKENMEKSLASNVTDFLPQNRF